MGPFTSVFSAKSQRMPTINQLIRKPRRPEWTPFSAEMFSLRRYREWMPFVSQVDSAYWNTELIQD